MDLIDVGFVAARVVVVFVVLLLTVMFCTWMERKVVADMQTRLGPMRAGPRGILLPLADGVKLFFKEGIHPLDADKAVYWLAPVIAVVPAFLGFAVIPFGRGVEIAGHWVPFQIANLNVGVLWVLAMSSLAIYGVVLAGWSSGSRYPLIGSVRSSAQMISYEVGMGLALVAVLMWVGSLNMNDVVLFQKANTWNILWQFPAFLMYFISALAETNRPPFDLAEAESELVAGFHTEYSGIKLATFLMAEYLHTITVCAIMVTLFLGGWSGPQFSFLPWIWPLVWFLLKLFALLYLLMWIRATLPRFRYDRLMMFGWKVLIPTGLVWIMFTGFLVYLKTHPVTFFASPGFRWGAVALLVIFVLAMLLWPSKDRRGPSDEPRDADEQEEVSA